MTERERWIVYPLLFLALGAALRDKLVDHTTMKSIVCQELTVVDEPIGNQPVLLARIGRSEPTPGNPPTGYLVVNGVVNARQYAYNGIPFVPAVPAGLGIPLPDFLRAMQDAARRKQSDADPSSNAPKTSSAPDAPPSLPLAEPPANR